MEYTDRFFEFPIVICDGFEAMKAQKEEEEMIENDIYNAKPVDAPSTIGVASVLPDEILGWTESFSKSKTVDDVNETGFDLLVIDTKNQGVFVTTLSRKEFKKKLNDWWKKHASSVAGSGTYIKNLDPYNTNTTGESY